MQEESKWLNDFYQEVNAGKRMELWQKHVRIIRIRIWKFIQHV